MYHDNTWLKRSMPIMVTDESTPSLFFTLQGPSIIHRFLKIQQSPGLNQVLKARRPKLRRDSFKAEHLRLSLAIIV